MTENLNDEKVLDPLADPVSALLEKARRNLETIGLVGVEHIMEAFKDKDARGHYTTAVEIKTTYWNPLTKEVLWARSNTVTIMPEVILENGSGFTNVILQFPDKDNGDMNRIWSILEDYGKDTAKLTGTETEIPVLNIAAVPMSLGGKYGMLAIDPIFWHLQPKYPYEVECKQIRILFQPESVQFLRDDSFESEEVVAKVKAEMAAEKLANESREKKLLEDAEFARQREAELTEYLENGKYSKHTFQSTKKSTPAEKDD